MLRRLAMAISVLGLIAGAVTLAPRAQAAGVRVGVLTCNVSSGYGFIFGSSRSLACTFAPASHRYEHYVGSINKFGVDIGYIHGGVLVWSVLAPTAVPSPCALAGAYNGVAANATVGVGAGANVLVGGNGNSFTLQPLSIEGTTGLNVAAGIASMSLRCAPP
ncbi:MAG TPA: DUF992 domain-containing protein [Stellaceae bacterium]|jgi:hypothetical protein